MESSPLLHDLYVPQELWGLQHIYIPQEVGIAIVGKAAPNLVAPRLPLLLSSSVSLAANHVGSLYCTVIVNALSILAESEL